MSTTPEKESMTDDRAGLDMTKASSILSTPTGSYEGKESNDLENNKVSKLSEAEQGNGFILIYRSDTRIGIMY